MTHWLKLMAKANRETSEERVRPYRERLQRRIEERQAEREARAERLAKYRYEQSGGDPKKWPSVWKELELEMAKDAAREEIEGGGQNRVSL